MDSADLEEGEVFVDNEEPEQEVIINWFEFIIETKRFKEKTEESEK